MLVIARAGDQSLHPCWIDSSNAAARLWDLHISYFGTSPEPFPDRAGDVTLSREPGAKFAGLEECLDKIDRLNDRRLDGYGWFVFPDDDLLADQTSWDTFCRYLVQYELDLAQPALDPASYFTFPITLRHTQALLRFTNFVEIMCPCFSRRALALCRPYFRENASAWGLDYLFPKLLGYPPRGIAIVDAAPVRHTRAVGGPAHALARHSGKNPKRELRELLRKYRLPKRENNLAVVAPDCTISDDLSGVRPLGVGEPWP